MDFTICRATKADFSLIRKLNADLFTADLNHDPDLDLAWPASDEGTEYYRQSLSDPHKIVLLAKNKQGRVVGYLIGSSVNKFRYRKVATGELENMFVTPEVRRQGIGKALVSVLKKWLEDKGVQRIYVSAYSNNAGAIAFYQSLGLASWEIGMELKIE